MATGRDLSLLENIDEKLLECSICSATLRNPRSLACLHSFCLACLENWLKSNHGKLSCPICRKLHPIPDGGLEKLPPNTFVNNLLEITEQFKKKEQVKCVCGATEQVTYYCKECRHYLCSMCRKHHKMLPMSAGHTLLAAEEVQSMTPQQFINLHPPSCSTHKKPLELYCTKCKVPICWKCAIVDHAKGAEHEPTDIVSAFKIFKGTADKLKDTANECLEKLENRIRVVKKNSMKLEESKNASLKSINEQFEEMVKIMKEKTDKLKKKVEEKYTNEKKINDMQLKELRTITSGLDTNVSFLNQSLKSEPATAMMSSEIALNTLKDHINSSDEIKQYDNEQINFFGNKLTIELLKQCDIGYVTPITADDLILKGPQCVTQEQSIVARIIIPHKIGLSQLKATWTQPTGETTNGFVEEYNNDYVTRGVCKNPGICRLNVYFNGKPIRQSPLTIKIEKKGLVNDFKVHKKPTVVVKCDDDCLLVSFCTNEIHKYKQSGECISKITLPKGVKVYRMYKMKNNNIAFSDKSCIKVCDMNGHVIKSIGEGVLTNPRGIHIDEATNVIYVTERNTECVCMFDINSGKELMRIRSQREGRIIYPDVTLTKSGKVLVADYGNDQIVSYDNEDKSFKVLVNKGEKDGMVMHPHGVVVDEDDNIIVSSHHKLQLFSSDGHFIKRIDQEEDGINNPCQLCIISYHPRRISVANYNGSNIKIFNY
ncbi:tripartite motif-containing protein 2-like [Antedon mediterranea]|uniref:tripartite motif-containing protein 2-like n=1 Tax=Antedon mediterranea TaxID=105859 RepID=UPI003AF9D527